MQFETSLCCTLLSIHVRARAGLDSERVLNLRMTFEHPQEFKGISYEKERRRTPSHYPFIYLNTRVFDRIWEYYLWIPICGLSARIKICLMRLYGRIRFSASQKLMPSLKVFDGEGQVLSTRSCSPLSSAQSHVEFRLKYYSFDR